MIDEKDLDKTRDHNIDRSTDIEKSNDRIIEERNNFQRNKINYSNDKTIEGTAKDVKFSHENEKDQ